MFRNVWIAVADSSLLENAHRAITPVFDIIKHKHC